MTSLRLQRLNSPEKKHWWLSQFPWQQGKNHKWPQRLPKKTQSSTGTKAGTSGDPTYEPGEGQGQGDDSESESESKDVIHPLIEQDLYVYKCYNVDISDGHYNTKTNIKTCPQKNQCYSGEQFETQAEFTQHEKQHVGQAWACFDCGKQSKGNDKQNQQKHIATCPGKKDKSGPKQTPYGEKNIAVMSVLKSTPQRLHSKITKRCTRAQTKNMCAASVAKL